MTGQLLFRATGQKSKSGKDVFIVLGLIGIDKGEVLDGFKYDLIDACVFQGKDYTELNNSLSPEELLEESIWRGQGGTFHTNRKEN